MMPALATITSSRPKVVTAASTIASASSLFETSPTTARTSPPAAAMLARSVSSRAASTSLTTSRAPSAAKRSAVARPMPLEAPVTTATLPFRRPSPTGTVSVIVISSGGAGRVEVNGIDGGAGGDEQAVPLLAAEAQVGGGLGQMDLADEVAVRGVAAHTVLAGIGPAHAAPDIAIGIRPHAVGKARSEILRENPPAAELRAVYVEDADMGRAAMGDAGVHHIKPPLIGREGEAVRAHEIIGDHRGLPARGIEAGDVARKFGMGRVAFIGAVDPVTRIGEPDGVVGGHHDIVGRVQRPAIKAIHEHRDA